MRRRPPNTPARAAVVVEDLEVAEVVVEGEDIDEALRVGEDD